jgi:hypothetical protein
MLIAHRLMFVYGRPEKRVMETITALPGSDREKRLISYFAPDAGSIQYLQMSEEQSNEIFNELPFTAAAITKKALRKAKVKMELPLHDEERNDPLHTPLTLANVASHNSPGDEPDSTIGGETACVICMTNPKTHLAAPCGHQCVCSVCSSKLEQCPYCRESVIMWVKPRMV